jgi:tetratricopeptide (TPR) repeat protein
MAVQWNPKHLAQAELSFRESIKLFDKVSRDKPDHPRVWLFLADTYAFLGEILWRMDRREEASDAFSQAMNIYDKHAEDIAAHPNPGGTFEVTSAYIHVASFLATTHREHEAADFIRKATLTFKGITDPSDVANMLYYLALIKLRLGDKAGYQATCQELRDLPIDKLMGLTKSRPIWTPSIGPDALGDMGPQVTRAEDYYANSTEVDQHFRLYVLGAAHFRAGQYQQAAQRLEESIAAFPARTSPATDSLNYHKLFLAMTHWHLGAADEARRLLVETLPEVDKELKSPASGWNRRATLELLSAEAKALIGQEEAEEAVEYVERNQPAAATRSQQNPSHE